MQKETEFDVVIVGGGMAGSTLAYALSVIVPELSVAIIEKQAPAVASVSFDSRSIALAAGSVTWLQQSGLWPLLNQYACAITDIAVSDRGHFGKTWLNAAEYQLPALGYVLEVENLGTVLQQQLRDKPLLTRFQPAEIASITPTTASQQIRLQDGTLLSTKLLVFADGNRSVAAQSAGFQYQQQDYPQTALIANLALERPHQGKAFERFTETGPIALLPLTGQRYSLVWTVSPEQADTLLQLPESAFQAQIQKAFGYRAGIFTKVGQRAAYPLLLRRAEQVVRHRTLLLGNSLHSIHPVAGQGFNLAIRDIIQLTTLAAEYRHQLGEYAMLRAYEQQRQADMKKVIWLTDSLVRLFSNSSRFMALIRNTGLLAMLLSDDLKRPLAEQTMGNRVYYAKR